MPILRFYWTDRHGVTHTLVASGMGWRWACGYKTRDYREYEVNVVPTCLACVCAAH